MPNERDRAQQGAQLSRGEQAVIRMRERRGAVGSREVLTTLTAIAALGLIGFGAYHMIESAGHVEPVASTHPTSTPDHHTPTPTPDDPNHIVNIPFNPGDHAGYFVLEQQVNGQWYDSITLDVFTQHVKETQWGQGLTDDQAAQIFQYCHDNHISANYLLATAQTFPSQHNNLGSQLGPENAHDSYPIHNADGTTSWYRIYAPGFDGKMASVHDFVGIVAGIAQKHEPNPPTVQEDEGDYYGTHDGGVSLGELSTRIERHMHDSNIESMQLHPGDVIPVDPTQHNGNQATLNPADEIFASLFTAAA